MSVTEKGLEWIQAMQNPTSRNSIIIKNVSGKEIARMKVGQAYEGFIVESIGEILLEGKAPESEVRAFSGTYKLVLKGVGGVLVTIIDGQEPTFVVTMTSTERKLPSSLHFNDNVASFNTF